MIAHISGTEICLFGTNVDNLNKNYPTRLFLIV